MDTFNPYIKNIDKDFIKQLCISKGQPMCYQKDEYFAKAGYATRYVAYIKKGYFKYTTYNQTEYKEYIVGFAFEDEFVADYPLCLYNKPACVTIKAAMPCEVYLLEGKELQIAFEQEETKELGRITAEQLFLQFYKRYLNLYAKTPEERYRELLQQCPQIFQTLSLKEIASYLKVTPTTVSTIRRKITFGE